MTLTLCMSSWCFCRDKDAVGAAHPGWGLRPRIHPPCLRGVSSFGPEVPESSCRPVLCERYPPAPSPADTGQGEGVGEGEEARSLLISGSGHAHPTALLGPQSLDDPWEGGLA